MDTLNQHITPETARLATKFALIMVGVFCMFLTKDRYGASGVAAGIYQERIKLWPEDAELAMYKYAANRLCGKGNLCAAVATLSLTIGGAL